MVSVRGGTEGISLSVAPLLLSGMILVELSLSVPWANSIRSNINIAHQYIHKLKSCVIKMTRGVFRVRALPLERVIEKPKK